jgi:L-lactate utilization protein LutB
MDIDVMDAIALLKRGEIAKAAEATFDCVQCGLCASRCMGELPQYHIFQLVRRIYGGKIAPKAEHLSQAVKTIGKGQYQEMLEHVMRMSPEELRQEYLKREIEPETSEETWQPQDTRYILEVED